MLAVRDAVRKEILPYATSDWLRWAPSLVSHIHDVVEALPPGISLDESMRSEPPRVEVSGPSMSQSLTLPVPAASSLLRSSSTGSGASRPSPIQSVVDLTDRPARPLPRRVVPMEVPSVLVPPLPVSFSRPAPPAPSPVAASASAARSTAKRPAAGAVTPAYEPLENRPSGWLTCAWCRRRKSKCRPPVGAEAPYSSCTVCLNLRQPCRPGPVKTKRAAKKTSPVVKPKALVAASPVGKGAAAPAPLGVDDPFPTVIPPLPTSGSFRVPLADIMAWRAELESAVYEHNAALFARNAAEERLVYADQRRRIAWDTYMSFSDRAGAPSGRPDKGKRRASPVSVDDDSAEEEEEDDEIEDEEDGGFGGIGDEGAMDMS